jgi:hypothetical protein
MGITMLTFVTWLGYIPAMSTVVRTIRISAKGIAGTGGKMDRVHQISRAMNTGIKQKRKGKNDGNRDICKALSMRDP